jgi:hypothetical protein
VNRFTALGAAECKNEKCSQQVKGSRGADGVVGRVEGASELMTISSKIRPERISDVFDWELQTPVLLSDEETELVAGGFSSVQQTALFKDPFKDPLLPTGWSDGTPQN